MDVFLTEPEQNTQDVKNVVQPDAFKGKYGLPRVADIRIAVEVGLFEGHSLQVREEDLV